MTDRIFEGGGMTVYCVFWTGDLMGIFEIKADALLAIDKLESMHQGGGYYIVEWAVQ